MINNIYKKKHCCRGEPAATIDIRVKAIKPNSKGL